MMARTRKTRQSRYDQDDGAAPNKNQGANQDNPMANTNMNTKKKNEKSALTAVERQLLMIDDDRADIMNERDSLKMGHYMIAQKTNLLNEDLGAEMAKNYEMKRKVRNRMEEAGNPQMQK